MNSIPLTNLIAEFHQLLNALLVGVVLLSILKADRVENEVRVNMLAVDMSCHYNFVFVEGFLCELHCNFVCKFRLDLISARKALH